MFIIDSDGQKVSMVEVIDGFITLLDKIEWWGEAGEMEIIPIEVLF